MIHSLHHRNQDIEPFAGLSMHPMEHVYYYACVLPSLIPGISPFAFVWNGMHLLLSPGASHSGWEDHAGSGAFHYMHHRYFEVNYAGYGAAALDVFFGSFCNSFAAKEGSSDNAKLVHHEDAKSTLKGLPSMFNVLYILASFACIAVWALGVEQALLVAGGGQNARESLFLTASILSRLPPSVAAGWASFCALPSAPLFLSCLAGFGPVVLSIPFAAAMLPGSTLLGMTLSLIGLGKCENMNSKVKGAPILHFILGSAVTALPIMWAAYLCFPPT